MGTKENYEKKLQAQLDEWAAEIDTLKAKAQSASAGVQIEYNKQVHELQNKQKTAREKLAELKTASEETWEELKEEMESMWNSLERTLKSAVSTFK